jgi:hypothetical protein
MDALNQELDEAFNAIIFKLGTVPEYFENASGLLDGPAYGLVFNARGVAVNDFLPNRSNPKVSETCNLNLIDCSVNGIKAKTREIPALVRSSGDPPVCDCLQVDTAGAVFRFFDEVAQLNGDKYYYGGTSLSKAQIELARLRIQNPQAKGFGTLQIDAGLVAWADDASLYFQHDGGSTIKLFNGNGSEFQINGHPIEYRIVGNGDTMHHVNKGVMAIRIDGATRIYSSNLTVSNVENQSAKGSMLAGQYVKSMPIQSTVKGYGGTDTYGIVVSASGDGTLVNTQVSNVSSHYGSSHGILIQNGSCHFDLKNTIIRDVRAGTAAAFDPSAPAWPNKAAVAKALGVGKECSQVKLQQLSVEKVAQQELSPYDGDLDLKSVVSMS